MNERGGKGDILCILYICTYYISTAIVKCNSYINRILLMLFIEKHLFNCYIFRIYALLKKFLIFILERYLKYLKGNYYLFCYTSTDFLKRDDTKL